MPLKGCYSFFILKINCVLLFHQYLINQSIIQTKSKMNKKNSLICFLIFFGLHSMLQAQNSINKVLDAQDVTFYGLDFSALQLVHKDGFYDAEGTPICDKMRDTYFPAWNNMMQIERKKYDLSKFLGFKRYSINLEQSNTKNLEDLKSTFEGANCISENIPGHISKSKAAEVLKGYNTESDKNPIGLIIIPEMFSKQLLIGVYSIVYFDTKTKDVLMTDVVEGKPKGFGVRNYWIGSLYAGLKSYSKIIKARRNKFGN